MTELALANTRGEVAKTLSLYGAEQTWANLYKVLEAIGEDSGPVEKHGWASKTKIDLFRRTANSYRALGVDARHAHVKHEAPRKPMPEEEAAALIRSVVEGWLDWKLSSP